MMGSLFIAVGILVLVGFLYAAVLSKIFLPQTPHSDDNLLLLSAIQNDRYYCLLIPLTLPVIVAAVYLHWLSMKMFKHA
uniref:Uncharacterized protein n=1 Tax=Oryza rufipogon TaxID=4529 RepID=A0A0E0PLN6_ORYRU